jgi:molecular chaperone DnaJ
MQLRMQGKGNSGPMGGPAGDLIVLIEEIPHGQLTRDGENIHYELYVSFPDAVLGSAVEVPTISGKVRIKIDAGVQSGKILRLKGKGLPSVEGYGRGDQLIHINVWTPRNLSKEQHSLVIPKLVIHPKQHPKVHGEGLWAHIFFYLIGPPFGALLIVLPAIHITQTRT